MSRCAARHVVLLALSHPIYLTNHGLRPPGIGAVLRYGSAIISSTVVIDLTVSPEGVKAILVHFYVEDQSGRKANQYAVKIERVEVLPP